jgi:hypothetical protein
MRVHSFNCGTREGLLDTLFYIRETVSSSRFAVFQIVLINSIVLCQRIYMYIYMNWMN